MVAKIADGALVVISNKYQGVCTVNTDTNKRGLGEVFCTPMTVDETKQKGVKEVLTYHLNQSDGDNSYTDQIQLSFSPSSNKAPGTIQIGQGKLSRRNCQVNTSSALPPVKNGNFSCGQGVPFDQGGFALEKVKDNLFTFHTVQNGAKKYKLGVSGDDFKMSASAVGDYPLTRKDHNDDDALFEIYYVKNCNNEVSLEPYNGLGTIYECNKK